MNNMTVAQGNILAPVRPDPGTATASDPTGDEALRQSARDFEAVFISQMLQYAGFAKALTKDTGSGSAPFASMYLNLVAEDIAEAGGFGLQQQIYQTLSTKATR